MASTAGNLLVRAGKITPEQLAKARALSVEQSCPLAEALIRSRVIDEPTLVEFFARRLMIERLPPSKLHAIPKPILRSVPPDMANEFRVVPIEFGDDGAIVLAMADPTDTHAVDEVRFFTDRFVVRTVARLSEIYHALGVYYGADFEPLPSDEPGLYSDLPIDDGDDEYAEYEDNRASLPPLQPSIPLTSQPPISDSTSPTLLDSPMLLTKVKSRAGEIVIPEAASSTAPDAGTPPSTTTSPSPSEPSPTTGPEAQATSGPPSAEPSPPGPSLDQEAIPVPIGEAPTEPLRPIPVPARHLDVPALVASASAAVAGGAAGAPVDPDEPILLTRPIKKRRSTLPGAPAPMVPLEPIRNATSRDEVASLMLDYVALLCRRSLLFVIRRGQLVGFAARGDEAPRLAQLSLPLDAPTLLRDVIVSRLPYRGPLPITEENDRFADALGGVATEVLVMPITIREKLIALLYADGPLRPLPDAELHAVTREVGLAFERLILEKRPG